MKPFNKNLLLIFLLLLSLIVSLGQIESSNAYTEQALVSYGLGTAYQQGLYGFISTKHPSNSSATSAHGSVFYVSSPSMFRLTKLTVYTKRMGTPTVNITANVYEVTSQSYAGLPTGSPLVTSVPINASTLSVGLPVFESARKNFTFTTPYDLVANRYYAMAIQAGTIGTIDASNKVNLGFYNTTIPGRHIFWYQDTDGNGIGSWEDDALAVDCMMRMGIYGYGIYAFTFKGKFNEDTSVYYPVSQRATTVVAHYLNAVNQTFTVNGTYYFSTQELPIYFTYDNTGREYWVNPSEGYNSTLLVANTTLSAYTINFIDMSGTLQKYPFISAKRYMNGTLQTIEKRKVDSENKVLMLLKTGEKYTISIEGAGFNYVYGDLEAGANSQIILTIRGTDIPQDVILSYKYIRVYGYRLTGTPYGNITVTYQDTLSKTAFVLLQFLLSDGTIVHSYNTTSSSFTYVWTQAQNTTNYYAKATITHETLGTYTWTQYYPREYYTTNPFPLTFLGSGPTAYLISAFLIMFVFGIFSVLNVYMGAFFGTIAATILTYMGWIPISGGAIITAFFLAFVLALIYAKKRSASYY